MVAFNADNTYTVTCKGDAEEWGNVTKALARLIAIRNPEFPDTEATYFVAMLLEDMLEGIEGFITAGKPL